MIKKVLKTVLIGIGFSIVIGNPTTYGESNISYYTVEKEIVSVRTISVDETPSTGSQKNSKTKATTKSVKTVTPKYLSLKEVKHLTNKKMDLSKPSGLSKENFVELIKKMDYDYTKVFERNAEYVWELAHKYKFNEIFFMAIIANESLWGASELAIANNNYTSQMITEKQAITKDGKIEIVYKQKMISYPSEKECFLETARNLGKNYLTKGGKYYRGTDIFSVNESYCEPGKHEDGSPYKYMWAKDTYTCMEMILGK